MQRSDDGRRVLSIVDKPFQRNWGTARGFIRYVLGAVEASTGAGRQYCSPELSTAHRLVFVCLGNINRSAFAHAVARVSDVRCASIGLSTSTGSPATIDACLTAEKLGYELQSHRSTAFDDFKPLPEDLFLVMETRHARQLESRGIARANIALLGHWALPRCHHLHDPHTLSEEYFERCFRRIEGATRHLLAEAAHAHSPCLR